MAVWVEKAVAQEARKSGQRRHPKGRNERWVPSEEAVPPVSRPRGGRFRQHHRGKNYAPMEQPQADTKSDARDAEPVVNQSKEQKTIKVQTIVTTLPETVAMPTNVGSVEMKSTEDLPTSSAEDTSETGCHALHADTCGADSGSLSLCPSSHALVEFTTVLQVVCGSCYNEHQVGAQMWGCRICDFDLCPHCQQQSQCSVHDGNSTDSTNTPRPDGEVSWTNVDDVWWPKDSEWSWDWNEQETDYDYELCPDEEALGPDGDLYEVFYPSDNPLEELCTSSQSGSAHSDASDFEHLSYHAQEGLKLQPCDKHASPPQTSAEIGILSILTFMRGVTAHRYPARALLFNTVQTAATLALGDHFDRFALVGSTALRIDTPDSDLDAVVFTRSSVGTEGQQVQPPMAAVTLKKIAQALHECDPSLQLQLVDCTRVPVLTAFSADGELSLDLTVDQPLSEWHVLWLQSQRTEPVFDSPFMAGIPVPTFDGWEQGLEAAALRCVKWWLRRRHIPVSKEGGYPTVVWTFMVIHALRCSVFYSEADSNSSSTVVNERTLLGAIAAFFDRFSEGGLAGTLLFAEGKHAQFWPQPQDCTTQSSVLSSETFSVLDPTTTNEDSAAYGIEPVELAPRISSATQLLQGYELQRAQQLSSLALLGEESSPYCGEGGAALSALFAEVDERINLIPVVVPEEPMGVIFLHEGSLRFGLLHCVNPKPGWAAAFLHRHDKHSRIGVRLCHVDVDRKMAMPEASAASDLLWIQPSDIVCMASVLKHVEASSYGRAKSAVFELDAESFERWCKMHILLGYEFLPPHSAPAPQSKGYKSRHARKRYAKAVRI